MATKTKSASARLRALREARGLTLSEAARQVGVSHVAWRNWEHGATPVAIYRSAVEAWSGGAIAADSWPLSGAEKRARARIDRARIDRARLAALTTTGTDG